jgi:hypothetical protein
VLEYAGEGVIYDEDEDDDVAPEGSLLPPEIRGRLEEIVAEVRRDLGPGAASDRSARRSTAESRRSWQR